MNGAELSCGTAMGVQPADMNYKEKISKNKGEDGEKILPCVCFFFFTVLIPAFNIIFHWLYGGR